MEASYIILSNYVFLIYYTNLYNEVFYFIYYFKIFIALGIELLIIKNTGIIKSCIN